MAYDFRSIEKKWQKKWEEKKVFEAKENPRKKKFYSLEMYPYPSGTGLHIGHAFNEIIGDIYSRFKKMQGFNVLHPMGYDSFGLPAENAAIKAKSHPKKFTDDAIKNFIKQQKALGLSYDWTRKIESHDPEYYKWDQWIFLKMFERGLAYRKKAPVNFCVKCNTVLANEQVQGGKCWRHEDTEVQIKNLEQWFLKITDYADEIYDKTDSLDWPERIKIMQKNWIGKSEGAEIYFEIENEKWKVFTTRPDTLFGVTFLVISAQHPKLMELVTEKQKKEVEKFVKKIKSTREEDLDKLEKEGVFTGSYAIHPLTKEKIPLWAGNFVVAEYGSGMVMGVPAHDQRDFEFAQKYNLPIKIVVRPDNSEVEGIIMDKAYTGAGYLVNSNGFDKLFSEEAKEHIVKVLEGKKLGKKTIQFRLRDWLISRQRFWGTPIPIVYCDKCGIQPVKEKDLPIVLPDNVKFASGKNPLIDYRPFTQAKCPKCGGKGKRETDTMDTFVNSSWYFFRYLDSKNKRKIFEKKKADYWMPVDFYTGGAEHACLHLIYSRFYTKFFRDIGLTNKKLDEPFTRLFNQGMVHAEDGRKMSKSLGNVIDPTDMTEKFGADALRIFLISVASPESDFAWNSKGIESMHKFVSRIYEFFEKFNPRKKSSKIIESKLNKAITEISEDIGYLKYNLAVIRLRKLFEHFQGEDVSKNDAETFLKIFNLFCPHISEEVWGKLGNKDFICNAKWPKADMGKIDEEIEKQEEIAESLVNDINNVARIISEKENKKPSSVFVYTIPGEKEIYFRRKEMIMTRTGLKAEVFSANEKSKHDPEGKAKKAKPGKPAIYLE